MIGASRRSFLNELINDTWFTLSLIKREEEYVLVLLCVGRQYFVRRIRRVVATDKNPIIPRVFLRDEAIHFLVNNGFLVVYSHQNGNPGPWLTSLAADSQLGTCVSLLRSLLTRTSALCNSGIWVQKVSMHYGKKADESQQNEKNIHGGKGTLFPFSR